MVHMFNARFSKRLNTEIVVDVHPINVFLSWVFKPSVNQLSRLVSKFEFFPVIAILLFSFGVLLKTRKNMVLLNLFHLS